MLTLILPLIVCSSAYNITMEPLDYNFTLEPMLPNEKGHLPNHMRLSEVALGGMIPTTLIIVLVTILRIMQLYKKRKQLQPKIRETYV